MSFYECFTFYHYQESQTMEFHDHFVIDTEKA